MSLTPAMPEILQGDARALPLPDESVDLVVTSPPYFGLRDYGTDAQIGSEPTPAEFLAALIECTREMVRVLKPSGSIFVNLGDKYVANRRGPCGDASWLSNGSQHRNERAPWRVTGAPQKSLLMLPERYRIACVDELGLIARAVIVWAKPNGLPESVTDRVRRSHEDWVHLTKSPRYFSAVDEIREPHTMKPQRRPGGRPEDLTPRRGQPRQSWSTATREEVGVDGHPLGKLPGSVWTIPTQPLKVPASLGVDHFAAFPMEWPRQLIQGWSPREVCTACGEGRRPVSEKSAPYNPHQNRFVQTARPAPHGGTRDAGTTLGWQRDTAITGYACACQDTSAPSSPGVVLDPFSGTGTTALVATMLGRRGVGVDLNPDYCRLAQWRASDPKERARAAGLDPDAVAKVAPQLPGQFDIFGEAVS